MKIYFSNDINEIGVDIHKKYEEINLIKKEYESQFTQFKLSNEIINFFEIKLIDKIIIPNYNELNKFINQISDNYDHNNLNINIEEYKGIFSIQKFENNINETSLNFSSNFNNYTHILNNYGTTKEIYELNLKKKRDNYDNELNEDDNAKYNINSDIYFNELKNKISLIEQNIKNLSIFIQFEEKINTNKKEKENQYKYSQYILSLNNDNNNDLILGKLKELNHISLDYYSKANYSYMKMKENLNYNISKINELIKRCENITYQTFNTYYFKLKSKFQSFQGNNTIENLNIIIPDYKYTDLDNVFEIKGTNASYTMTYEFMLDIIFNEEIKSPKVIGNLFYNIKPFTLSFDFYSHNLTSGKMGRRIDIIFNNLISNMKIVFDSNFNNVTIINNFIIEKYLIKTQYFENKINSFEKVLFGIHFYIPDIKNILNIHTPYNEESFEINSKNKTKIIKYIY